MKMTMENYQVIKTGIEARIEDVKKQKQFLQEAKEKDSTAYNCLETRLAFDCLRLFGWDFIDKLYEENGLNDEHIGTGLKKALRELAII